MPKEVSFRISKIQFWAITLLILLLPISSKYKLILFGSKAEGTVIAHQKVATGFSRLSGYDTYAVIEFKTDSVTVRMYGPENFEYKINDKLTVFYNKQNPKQCMVFNVAYLYTSSSAIIPYVILLIWIAFYLSFKEKSVVKKTFPKNHAQ